MIIGLIGPIEPLKLPYKSLDLLVVLQAEQKVS